MSLGSRKPAPRSGLVDEHSRHRLVFGERVELIEEPHDGFGLAAT
jgi:hypothetical protein